MRQELAAAQETSRKQSAENVELKTSRDALSAAQLLFKLEASQKNINELKAQLEAERAKVSDYENHHHFAYKKHFFYWVYKYVMQLLMFPC